MKPELLLLPIFSTVLGWLFARLLVVYFFRPYNPVKIAGITFQGIISKNKRKIAAVVAAAVRRELLDTAMIRQKLADPETLQKTLPLIEEHIDHFLNVKLKASLPVITMFIGERVTNQLKELFMKELEELFPSVMNRFIDGLQNSGELETEIAKKIESIPVRQIEDFFYSMFKTQIRKFSIGFSAAGFIIGIVQLIVLLLLST